jgi:serine/threonine protein kinase
MQIKNLSTLANTVSSFPENVDYTIFLQSFNVHYKLSEYHLQVGEIADLRGWIFYIPVCLPHLSPLLEKLVPYLLSRNIAFKIPFNREMHYHLKEGAFGYERLGKVICIYPDNQSDLESLAIELISLTKTYKGTIVPTAACLDGIVHVRYGPFIPIVRPDGEYFYDDNGIPVEDEYTIPFRLPEKIHWPFKNIANWQIPIPKKVLNNKYYLEKEIAILPKGRVMQGKFREGVLNFQPCFIKEGKPGMFSDNAGRDIGDRLLWQQQLLLLLADKIPLPYLIDYFKENGNIYLVMEYINGITFHQFLDEQFMSHNWVELPEEKRQTVISYLLEITNLIGIMHREGYVHRDISATNFMIDKKGKLYILDIELAYDVSKSDPPFDGGTPGYMSPEQRTHTTPDFTQDIYSMGALMLTAIVRLDPQKFTGENLYNNLFYFIHNKELTTLIVRCLDDNPERRPSISEIAEVLSGYGQQPDIEFMPIINKGLIKRLVEQAVSGLYAPDVINHDNYWTSQVFPFRQDRNVFVGLYKGIGGILYLLSRVEKAGIPIDTHNGILQANWTFLCDRYLDFALEAPSGLFNDKTGIAIALTAALDAGLIKKNKEHITYLKNLLHDIPQGIDVENGIAGYGIAILKCLRYLDLNFVNERLSAVIVTILELQNRNGTWLSDKTLPVFEKGNAGITWFLLECYQLTRNSDLLKRVDKSLQWLAEKYKATSIAFNGTAGVALTFIKAFEVTGYVRFKSYAEKMLLSIPSRVTTNNYTFNNGLAGLGEIYLEAYRVFKNNEWHHRAGWIAGTFLHTNAGNEEIAYWIQNDARAPYADLIIGNSGIIHFLLRYLYPEKVPLMILSDM